MSSAILSKKSLLFSALVFSLVGTYTAPASAQISSINVSGKDTVTFVVSNLSKVTGFGGHFSTTQFTDGLGGADAECHFRTHNQDLNLLLVCYDGYSDPQNHVNQFRLELGPKKEFGQDVLSHVTFTVSRRAVNVEAVRIANNSYTSERKPYIISGSFPIREGSGFFKTGTIFYKVDGVLNGELSRAGSGYVLANPIAR